MDDSETRGPIPPYVSFGTLLNQLERMAKEGVPSRVDASFLIGMAGGTQNQFKQAMRALGLIDESDRPTRSLEPLVKDAEARPRLVGELLTERFPLLVRLDENATRGQLDEVLATYGLGAETRRKAAGFYLAAATYAGLPLSPFLKPSRGPQTSGTTRRRPRAMKRTNPEPIGPESSPSLTTPDQMRHAYFDLLLDKAKNSDELDTDLLNRIERLIGVQDGGTGKVEEL